jgi:hypothetical protein
MIVIDYPADFARFWESQITSNATDLLLNRDIMGIFSMIP